MKNSLIGLSIYGTLLGKRELVFPLCFSKEDVKNVREKEVVQICPRVSIE